MYTTFIIKNYDKYLKFYELFYFFCLNINFLIKIKKIVLYKQYFKKKLDTCIFNC